MTRITEVIFFISTFISIIAVFVGYYSSASRHNEDANRKLFEHRAMVFLLVPQFFLLFILFLIVSFAVKDNQETMNNIIFLFYSVITIVFFTPLNYKIMTYTFNSNKPKWVRIYINISMMLMVGMLAMIWILEKYF